MNKISLCVYCAKEKNTTRDHVPPKNLFPNPKPSNLITVPCCDSCNKEKQKDEDYFRSWILFGKAGITNQGKIIWDQKLNRTYEKDIGLKKAIARSFKEVEIKTPSGIYLGKRLAIQAEWNRIERVISKIVKGLYYFEYNEIMSNNVQIKVAHITYDKKMQDEMKKLLLLPGKRKWYGIFEYARNRVESAKSNSAWLLLFFNSNLFAVLTRDKKIGDVN